TWLCENQPATALFPADPARRAAINSWISFALTDLESPVWNLLKQMIFVPEAQRSAALTHYFKTEAAKAVAMVDLADNAPWITGNDFTLADIFMSHTLFWAKLGGITLGETLENYVNRAFSRPAFTQAQLRNNQ
ncbi:glutathione S-transferase family protein, partial [Cronobacter malonaticus]|uniref:glutathione S-transferase family protein n=1 Tax=Cronobacter malonaticus TaxID=413503 RepID=UPI001E652C83